VIHEGEISIGKYSLITPGVRIMAAEKIEIGDACMIAHGAYISDADWHGIYDRAEPVGKQNQVVLKIMFGLVIAQLFVKELLLEKIALLEQEQL
jgi:acetyltransferase-like isoleucine patch superfamily enzyme